MSMQFPENSIFICNGSKCGKHKDVRKAIKELIKERQLRDIVEVFKMECSDRCKHAPIICVQPMNKWYSDVTVEDAGKIVDEITK